MKIVTCIVILCLFNIFFAAVPRRQVNRDLVEGEKVEGECSKNQKKTIYSYFKSMRNLRSKRNLESAGEDESEASVLDEAVSEQLLNCLNTNCPVNSIQLINCLQVFQEEGEKAEEEVDDAAEEGAYEDE